MMKSILTRVVRERSGVTSSEVEGASFGVTDENSGTGLSLVEVQPFLGLWRHEQFGLSMHEVELTLGCQ